MSRSVGPDRPVGAESIGSLWRDRNFLTLWTGQAFSQFGAQVFELALPVLAVLLLHGDCVLGPRHRRSLN